MKMYCAYFVCSKKKNRFCCAACEDKDCAQRCLNDPKKCGLCSSYPRPELHLPAEGEQDVG